MTEEKKWYEKSADIWRYIVNHTETEDYLERLAESYNEPGGICEDEGSMSEAEAWYCKCQYKNVGFVQNKNV